MPGVPPLWSSFGRPSIILRCSFDHRSVTSCVSLPTGLGRHPARERVPGASCPSSLSQQRGHPKTPDFSWLLKSVLHGSPGEPRTRGTLSLWEPRVTWMGRGCICEIRAIRGPTSASETPPKMNTDNRPLPSVLSSPSSVLRPPSSDRPPSAVQSSGAGFAQAGAAHSSDRIEPAQALEAHEV